jgi:hypothetical protein
VGTLFATWNQFLKGAGGRVTPPNAFGHSPVLSQSYLARLYIPLKKKKVKGILCKPTEFYPLTATDAQIFSPTVRFKPKKKKRRKIWNEVQTLE